MSDLGEHSEPDFELVRSDTTLEFEAGDLEELFRRLDVNRPTTLIDEEAHIGALDSLQVYATPLDIPSGSRITFSSFFHLKCKDQIDSEVRSTFPVQLENTINEHLDPSFIIARTNQLNRYSVFSRDAPEAQLFSIQSMSGGSMWIVETDMVLLEDESYPEHLDKLEEAINHLLTGMSIVGETATHGIRNLKRFFSFELPKPEVYYQDNDDNGYDEEPFVESRLGRFVAIDDVVKRLRSVVLQMRNRQDLAKRGLTPIQGVLLHGRSGTGKTELLYATAADLNAHIRSASFGELSDGTVSVWAKKIDGLFAEVFAEADNNPGEVYAIIFDEFDGKITSGNKGVDSNITTVLKDRLEELPQHTNVIVLAAANDISGIDENIKAKKRLPLQIGIQSPSHEQLQAIARRLVARQVFGETFEVSDSPEALTAGTQRLDKFDFKAIAEAAKTMSAGDLVSAITDAGREAFVQSLDIGTPQEPLTQEQLMMAIRRANESRA